MIQCQYLMYLAFFTNVFLDSQAFHLLTPASLSNSGLLSIHSRFMAFLWFHVNLSLLSMTLFRASCSSFPMGYWHIEGCCTTWCTFWNTLFFSAWSSSSNLIFPVSRRWTKTPDSSFLLKCEVGWPHRQMLVVERVMGDLHQSWSWNKNGKINPKFH